jgi:hypothetical protein
VSGTPASGAAASTGDDIDLPGGDGGFASPASTFSGFGGASHLSGTTKGAVANGGGTAGKNYGGGGAGAFRTSGTQSGGTGAAGTVIVTEYKY